jgi:farnesyl diphosphate synthase
MAVTREQFEEIFPVLVQDLTNHCCEYNLPEKALVWFRNVREFDCICIAHPID